MPSSSLSFTSPQAKICTHYTLGKIIRVSHGEPKMDFAESNQYLLSLGNEVTAMKLGLENIEKLLAAIGNPQNRYLKVQVAGTNGKGSVCAFLDAICNAAGIKTGLTTSPHLVSITERVRINGSDVTEDEFARLAARVRQTAERLVATGELETVPTYFEQVTAIALLAFANAGVELAILETGLGGRLDATTATKAETAAITRIDYDHQNILGESFAEIAAEKAAILRPGIDAVVGEQPAEAMAVILGQCDRFGLRPKSALDVSAVVGNNGAVVFETRQSRYDIRRLGLLGRHQIENAKVAILVAETLQEHFSITGADIIAGLESARHAGRLEFQGRFLFDGAHNVGGTRALRQFLDECIDRPVNLIFGAMSEKDVKKISEILFPKASWLILTEPDNTRSLKAAELAKIVPTDFDSGRIVTTTSVADALEKSVELSSPGDLVLVTGSLYLVGEAKKILERQSKI